MIRSSLFLVYSAKSMHKGVYEVSVLLHPFIYTLLITMAFEKNGIKML